MVEEAKLADQGVGQPKNPKRRPWYFKVLAIAGALVIALLGCVLLAYWGLAREMIVRSRNNAAQSSLNQLAVSQVTCEIKTGRYCSDWESLDFDFRPDPNVRLELVLIDLELYGHSVKSFIARANHAQGKTVFLYNLHNDAGVEKLLKAKPLGDEFGFYYEKVEGSYSGRGPRLLHGPPIVLIWARVPLSYD